MELHNIEPVFDERSEVLILGSFPSVLSREQRFFYAHPRNRFWKVMAAVYETSLPQQVEQKKKLLLENHLALWDVIASCTIRGSSDLSISDVTANDLNVILDHCPIRKIICNGSKAYELYEKLIYPQSQRTAVKLPSTSPANAAWSLDELINAWKRALLKEEEND